MQQSINKANLWDDKPSLVQPKASLWDEKPYEFKPVAAADLPKSTYDLGGIVIIFYFNTLGFYTYIGW